MCSQFLAMKADLAFWGEKGDRESMQGLSTRTVLTQTFCSLVICAYVWHEGASLLVRIPIAISTAIDLWKGTRGSTDAECYVAFDCLFYSTRAFYELKLLGLFQLPSRCEAFEYPLAATA